MNWTAMIPVVVALLGIGSALITGYFAGRRQARAEYQREARLAFAELTKSTAVAVHTMAWFAWKAKYRAALMGPADAAEYDKNMQDLFPTLSGSLALVAAFSESAYLSARQVVDEVYLLDHRVAEAATGLLNKEPNAAAALAALHDDASKLEASSKQMIQAMMAEL